MKRLKFLVLMLLTLAPGFASAWWSDDWGFKKKISLDVQQLKKDGVTVPEDSFALIRLHTGNFLSFAELAEQGKDIRILAEDETTPLKFYIEKLDPINEMALIWVKLPKSVATAAEPSVWLYFGNPEAVDGQDVPGSYNVSQVLSYQFTASGIKDATANANNPSESTAANGEGGLIAGAALFQGSQIIRIPATPSLLMSPTAGWTVSTWLKIDQAQQDTVVFQRNGSPSSFSLSLKEQMPVLQVTDATGSAQEFIGQAAVTLAAWHNLTIVATPDNLTLYLDGIASGLFPVKLSDLNNEMTIGADATGGRGFSGALDQFGIYKVARDANAIKFDVQMQGTGSGLLTYEDDATPDSEGGDESYVLSTLNNVTVDGWVIIGILGVMCFISWMVMIVKAVVINRIHGENRNFEEAFSHLGNQDIATLNALESEDDKDYEESPLLFSLTKNHGAFTGSSLYRIYHVGVEEMNKRFVKAVGADVVNPQILSASSMAAVKASMDAVVVRELQKLNAQMVLLTIAISGGPFLGLLGTVVGVMITFAAIAASGEINVNAIAPGIAAALVATVAGLIVAIPALFGYNYLGSRIKVITADMHVFVDEFVAKLAEQHT
jgi:biopolymer transport protein ExbB